MIKLKMKTTINWLKDALRYTQTSYEMKLFCLGIFPSFYVYEDLVANVFRMQLND